MFKDLLKKFLPIIIREAIDVAKELILRRRNKKLSEKSASENPKDV
jgi:hypothetical protein